MVSASSAFACYADWFTRCVLCLQKCDHTVCVIAPSQLFAWCVQAAEPLTSDLVSPLSCNLPWHVDLQDPTVTSG